MAAAWTGSSAMLSEAVHSFVDTGHPLLLLYGMRQAALRADPDHPTGWKGALGYYKAFRSSKDRPSFVGLFEDSAALIGIVIAAFGIFAATRLGLPALDGAAAIRVTRARLTAWS